MALTLAAEKHNGQFRIGGQPYITHPVAVAQLVRDRGYGADYQIAALFHDLLEDTDTIRRATMPLKAWGGGGSRRLPRPAAARYASSSSDGAWVRR